MTQLELMKRDLRDNILRKLNIDIVCNECTDGIHLTHYMTEYNNDYNKLEQLNNAVLSLTDKDIDNYKKGSVLISDMLSGQVTNVVIKDIVQSDRKWMFTRHNSILLPFLIDKSVIRNAAIVYENEVIDFNTETFDSYRNTCIVFINCKIILPLNGGWAIHRQRYDGKYIGIFINCTISSDDDKDFINPTTSNNVLKRYGTHYLSTIVLYNTSVSCYDFYTGLVDLVYVIGDDKSLNTHSKLNQLRDDLKIPCFLPMTYSVYEPVEKPINEFDNTQDMWCDIDCDDCNCD